MISGLYLNLVGLLVIWISLRLESDLGLRFGIIIFLSGLIVQILGEFDSWEDFWQSFKQVYIEPWISLLAF